MIAKRLSIVLAALALFAGFGFSQEAVFEQVSGKVEFRSAGGSWTAASVGDAIPMNATISTGFGAEAILAIGQASVTVDPLTRLTLEELVQREGVVSTEVSLDVGRVEASVQSAEGLSNDFRVRSARSTASVRGTEFSYDGSTIRVSEGLVAFANNLGQRVSVAQGQGSRISADESDPPASGEWWAASETTVSPTTAGVGGEEAGAGGAGGGNRSSGLADIVIEF